MELYDELVERGLIKQTTNEEIIKEMINNGKAVFYIGFDPTADSLHVGHFMALCLMKRLQAKGNKPVVLVGGGTGMIGDPSGRTDLRQMLTVETINHNVECFKKQMSRFIDFSDDKAIIVNNADWLLKLNYVEFLRDIGPHFSVNRMLTAECYKQRMEQGLTFLEFNYMLMQSYDFYRLFLDYGCNMQFGGDDQWSNMLAGTELIRRKLGKDSHAMTITLLTNSEGKKMGKTAKGAVWLDANKTSPYEFFQYWRNIDDADVIKCIKMLTFLPMEQIREMEKWEGADLNKAKEILAYELTSLVHGKEEGEKCLEAAKNLFSGNMTLDNMPQLELKNDNLNNDQIELTEVLVLGKLCTSKGDARRNIEQGGVLVNDEKITDVKYTFNKSDLLNDGKVVKRGKKNFLRVFITSAIMCLSFVLSTFATNIDESSSIVENVANNSIENSTLDIMETSSLQEESKSEVLNNIKSNEETEELVEFDTLNMLVYDMENATYSDSLINPETNTNENGYLLNGKNNCSFMFTNPKTPNVDLFIRQYYMEEMPNNKIAKILLKEAVTKPSIPMEMLPSYDYKQLKNDNNKENKLFVIDVSYKLNQNDELTTQSFFYSYLDENDYKAWTSDKYKIKK